MIRKAIIWCRVSTTEQEFESQKQELILAATREEGFDKEDLIVIGEAGASAIKMNELYLKEVNELLDTIDREPDVKAIFVWEISRLARNEVAFYMMKDTIIKKKIQLICKVPQLRLFDANGEINTGSELTFNLLITLAKQEMEIKSKRFKRGKKRLAESGKYNGGAIPYGYKIDTEHDNLIVVDEGGEADVVREIYNMYENGFSQPKIARELYNRGIKGRAARATNGFTMSLVHQILTNELLTGKPHLNKGSSYERTYPMIITPEQFERCRQIAEKNNTVTPKSRRIYYAHRLIKCLGCGRYFVSTGNKGYYHCWDAYYTNKDINGYPNEPNCKEKVCISVNIMDSLLWELTKDFESTFILNSARDKVEECKKAINVLNQKIAALPSRRADLETKLDRLYEAYTDGMKKENYQIRKKSIQAEQKAIDADEALYREQLSKYEQLLEDISKNLEVEDDFDTEAGISSFLGKSEKVFAQVSSITDDEERYKLIHKHIEKVTIKSISFIYKFGIHPEGKDTLAKEIVVYPYLSGARTFIFVPYNGKGGAMLEKVESGGDVINVVGLPQIDVPEYLPFQMEYLPRIFDKNKYKRREVERARRESIKSKGTDNLRKEGYISMNEMRGASNLSYSTLYKAIKEGKMSGKNLFKTWYVKQVDFETYLEKYKPEPRPWKQKNHPIMPENTAPKSPEERLLDAITSLE